MTTSYPCPRCGATATLPDGCPGCGAGPDADAAEVIRLDREIADLTRQLHDARAHATALDRRLHDTRATRNRIAARVVDRRNPAPAPATAPAPAVAVPPAPVEPRLSTLTVQNLLFILGGLLLVVAAAVFTAVAWAQVGVTGRALLLAGATVAVLAVPPFAVRRGLTAAAETLAAVGLLMILLDGYAAWAVDFLWVRRYDPWGYVATVLAITAVLALAYASVTRLRGPRIAALLMSQPVFPLLAAAVGADLTGWSLAFTAVAALDLAVLRLRAARFKADGIGVLAYLCAVLAGAVGTLIALSDVVVATRPGPAAVAGTALLLPPILLLTWSILARRPVAQAFAAGLLVVTAGFAATRWAWTLPIGTQGSDWAAGRLAMVALVLAAVTAVLPRARPLLASTAMGAPPAPPSPTVPGPPPAASPLSAPTTDSGAASTASSDSPSSASRATPSPTSPSPATAATAASSSPSTSSAADHTAAAFTAPAAATPPATAAASPSSSSSASAAAFTAPVAATATSATSSVGLAASSGGVRSSGGGGSWGDAAGAAWLRRWVSGEAGFGAWVGALLVGVAPAVTVLSAAVAGAVRSTEAARPVFGAPWERAVAGPGPDLVVAAVVTALAYALMLPRRTHTNLGLTALAVVGLIVPAAFGLAWWTATVAGLVVAAVALGLAARARTLRDTGYRSAFCLVGGMHAIVTGSGNAEVIAAVLGVITVLGVGAALGLRNAPRGVDVGAGALVAGLFAGPAAVWMTQLAANVPVTGRVRVLLGTAVLLCLVAHAVNRWLPRYGPQALGVALVVTGFAPMWAAPGDDPAVLYSAAALLMIVALLPIPAARSAAGALAAVLPALALLALTAMDLAVVLLEPWAALRNVWSGIAPRQSPVAWSSLLALTAAGFAASVGSRLLVRSGSLILVSRPAGVTTSDSATIHSAPGGPVAGHAAPGYPGATSGGVAFEEPLPGGSSPETFSAESDRAGAGSAGGRRSEPAGASVSDGGPARVPVSATGPNGAAGSDGGPAGVPISADVIAACAAAPFVAVLVPLVFAAGGAAWPTVPIAGLITGLAGLLGVVLAPARHTVSTLLTVLFGALAAAGVAGSTAGHGATIAAFLLVLGAGLAGGVFARVDSDRVAGWLAGGVAVVVVAYAIADLADLGTAGPPLLVLAAAASVVALEWVLASRRPAEAWAPLVVAHASALVAVFLTESPGWAALVCKLWALVLTVRALRPGETRRGRFGYAVAAGSVALVGWWLLLSSRDVETTEVYTLPAAALAVVAGWFARRGRPELPSWSAYGAALAAAFLPTLAVIADSTADEPHYLRRLLLGVGALVVLLAGARARLQAPVVTGGGTLMFVALHELVQFWDLLPRWVPLAVGGLLLVGIATTMEQRRRDLARLRAAVARMA